VSLASHFRRKAIQGAIGDADENAGIYHAWAVMWHVEHMIGDQIAEVPLMFNPATNLSNARLDNATLGALVNVAKCNKVYRTRIHLCELPCELMTNKPHFQLMKVDGCTLCPACEHNLAHHAEMWQCVPADVQANIRDHAPPGVIITELGMWTVS